MGPATLFEIILPTEEVQDATKRGYQSLSRSQSMISSLETPQCVGAGEGTNSQDFLADLSTLEVIDPDSKGSGQ